jgi:hypothetical protein
MGRDRKALDMDLADLHDSALKPDVPTTLLAQAKQASGDGDISDPECFSHDAVSGRH